MLFNVQHEYHCLLLPHGRKRRRVAGIDALRMTEASLARAIRNVEHDVVRSCLVAGYAAHPC